MDGATASGNGPGPPLGIFSDPLSIPGENDMSFVSRSVFLGGNDKKEGNTHSPPSSSCLSVFSHPPPTTPHNLSGRFSEETAPAKNFSRSPPKDKLPLEIILLS